MQLSEIAKQLGATLQGDGAISIKGLATLETAGEGDIAFFHNRKYLSQLQNTQASAVIVNEVDAIDCPVAALIVKDPYFAYAQLANVFAYNAEYKGVHASAVVGEHCNIDASVAVAANAVIGNHVRIAKNAIIGPGVVIEDYVSIGEETIIKAKAVIAHHVQIGARCIIHQAAVIGSDGFGNAMHQGQWHKVPQIGSVIVGDDVEIGANTTVDRGTLGDTVIETGVRLDNLIQIGHNVKIGAHTAMAACSGVAGSVTIGRYCMIGGAAGISGHLSIADGVILTAGAQVSNTIKEKGIYSSGTALMPNATWRKNVVRYRKLDETIRKLQRSIKAGEHDGS